MTLDDGDIDKAGCHDDFLNEFYSPKIPIIRNSGYFERPDSPTLDDLLISRKRCMRSSWHEVYYKDGRSFRSIGATGIGC